MYIYMIYLTLTKKKSNKKWGKNSSTLIQHTMHTKIVAVINKCIKWSLVYNAAVRQQCQETEICSVLLRFKIRTKCYRKHLNWTYGRSPSWQCSWHTTLEQKKITNCIKILSLLLSHCTTSLIQPHPKLTIKEDFVTETYSAHSIPVSLTPPPPSSNEY